MYHDYDELLTAILNVYTNDFNLAHQGGKDYK
jgi:hypothetical protein